MSMGIIAIVVAAVAFFGSLGLIIFILGKESLH